MRTIFDGVLSMSFSATIVIVIILGLRQLFKKKFSKSFIYGLWILVLLRLILPVTLESPFSVFNYIEKPAMLSEIDSSAKQTKENLGYVSMPDQETLGLVGTNTDEAKSNLEAYTDDFDMDKGVVLQANDIFDPAVVDNAREIRASDVFCIVWIVIMILLFVFFGINYIRLDRTLKYATKFKSNHDSLIFTSDKIESPIIHGIRKPRIIIPSNYQFDEDELKYIILHEKTHIKRLDYMVKPLCLLVLCVHWFNPFVWMAFFIAMNDMELSCDEIVLKQFDKKQQTAYANTLLNISLHNNKWNMHPMVAFGEKNTTKRIKSALGFKKLSPIIRAIGILLIFILAIILVTDASRNEISNSDLEEVSSVSDNQEEANEIMDHELGENSEIDTQANEVSGSIEANSVVELSYQTVKEAVSDYDYDSLCILEETEEEVLVMMYNYDTSINGLLVHLDKNLSVISTEDFLFNEELEGYYYSSKEGDFRTQKYILGKTFRPLENGDMEGRIVCIPKDDLQQLYVLNEYVMPEMSQGEIPTIIDFTLCISGDYIFYQDIDGYYKAQNIVTGEIIVSNEDTTLVATAISNFNLTSEPIVRYSPIVYYQEVPVTLYFDRETKQFFYDSNEELDENMKTAFGEYDIEEIVYVGGISSLTKDAYKEKNLDTKYVVNEDFFVVIEDNNVTKFGDIFYIEEELTDDFIAEMYEESDEVLKGFFDQFESRVRYSIFDSNNEKVNYCIYLMDGEAYVSKFAREENLIFSIDKLEKVD